jgi:hypothetical protein
MPVTLLVTSTVFFGLVTIGTWKRVLGAPLIGAAAGIVVARWLFTRTDVVSALFMTVFMVGGFIAAARGIYTLRLIGKEGSSPK